MQNGAGVATNENQGKPFAGFNKLTMRFIRGFVIVTLFLTVVVFQNQSWADESKKDYVNWWIANYGVVSSADNPLVLRAERVFEKVYAAADKKGNRFPRLVIIAAKGDPHAQVIKDGSIIITSGAVHLCYEGVSPEKGDSRLAFILGHELAHLAKDDFWHAAAFAAVEKYGNDKEATATLLAQLMRTDGGDRTGREAKDFIKTKEIQADSYGVIYMTMAGYDPKVLFDGGRDGFIEEWVSHSTGDMAYGDELHPSPKERAEMLRTQLSLVAEDLDYFAFGVRLYQTGRYADAITMFGAFNQKFPGREVFGDIGASYLQLAVKSMYACDAHAAGRFILPAMMDNETLASSVSSTGGYAGCAKDPAFQKNIKAAVTYLKNSAEKDPLYFPARVNLASAFIAAGEYSKALGIADEALAIRPREATALNAKATAMYLFGVTNNIDMSDTAAGLFNEAIENAPDYPPSLYNLAEMLHEKGRDTAADDRWNAFLKMNPSGRFAGRARKLLKLSPQEPIEKEQPWKPPYPLKQIDSDTERALSGFKRRAISIGYLDTIIFKKKGATLYAINGFVEMESVEPPDIIYIEEHIRKFGRANNVIPALNGSTYIYSGYALDVVDGRVVEVVFFSGN